VACIHTSNKASVNKLRTAMYNFDETNTRKYYQVYSHRMQSFTCHGHWET